MNRNWFITLAVIVLVIGSFFVLTKRVVAPKTETTVLTPAKDSVQTSGSNGTTLSKSGVTYANGAFSPNPMRITKGTTVIFTSQNGNFWITSNPASAYPGFDEGSAGTSYSFTFSNDGTWNYQNKMDPSQTGQVVVTD